jgi:hypothetical protein
MTSQRLTKSKLPSGKRDGKSFGPRLLGAKVGQLNAGGIPSRGAQNFKKRSRRAADVEGFPGRPADPGPRAAQARSKAAPDVRGIAFVVFVTAG